MISDYVDPSSYFPDELANEKIFIDTIKREIHEAGGSFEYCEVKTLNELKTTLKRYDKSKIVVFNWCEFLEGKENTAHVVTHYLEEAGYIFTGSGTKTLKITNNKEAVKKVLIENHLPTPEYYVANSEKQLNGSVGFPVIVKLNDRHASAGISMENVVHNTNELQKVSKRLLSGYKTKLMIEKFIEGSEYTVTIWGNGANAQCIDINKEDFKDPKISNIFTETTKFDYSSAEAKNTISSALQDESIKKRLMETALTAYTVLGFSDYGVFEYRQGEEDDVYIIDCNPNPFLGVDAILFEASKNFGLNHGETILQICEFAVKRSVI